jgi:hypothetical protein
MAHDSFPLSTDDIDAPVFTPVRMLRNRHDGWSAAMQRRFIKALTVTGSVGAAAKMVQMSRKSAYLLRRRGDAESFAEAWDIAIMMGRARMFDYVMERALNGVTTFTVKLGGAIEIGHGPDGRLVAGHSKAPLPRENRFVARGGSLPR